MYDTIHLVRSSFKGYKALLRPIVYNNWSFESREKRKYMKYEIRNDGYTIMLKYDAKIRSLKIEFSLAKVLMNHNATNYNPRGEGNFIINHLNGILCQYIKHSVANFNVSRLDIALNLNLAQKSQFYIKPLSNILSEKTYTKKLHEYENSTISYRDKTTTFQMYDKIEEMGFEPDKNQNLLRIEYQIKNKQGIKAKSRFGHSLKLRDIFQIEVIDKSENLLLNEFYKLFPINKSSAKRESLISSPTLFKNLSKKDFHRALEFYDKFQFYHLSLQEIEFQMRKITSISIFNRKKIIQAIREKIILNKSLGYYHLCNDINLAIKEALESLDDMTNQRFAA